MNFIKYFVVSGIIIVGFSFYSMGIFSAEKEEKVINQKVKPITTNRELIKPIKEEGLTLEQAKAKGLTTHTFSRQHNALVGEDGIKYLAYDTGKGYQLFVVEKDKKNLAKNGTYKIKGGGTIKVKDGRIVWSDSVINSRFPHQGYTSGVIGLG